MPQQSQEQKAQYGRTKTAAKGSIHSPQEVRKPDKAELVVVKVGNASIAKAKLQPGWKWSKSLKPLAKTDTCMASHFGVVVAGKCHISQNDGTEMDLEPGDVFSIPPGHDAWVVGDVPFEAYEFESQTAEDFGKPVPKQ